MFKKICACGKSFITRHNEQKRCSRSCSAKEVARKRWIIGNINGFKKGHPAYKGSFKKGCVSWIRGKHLTEEHIKNLRKSKKGKHYSHETEFKKGHNVPTDWIETIRKKKWKGGSKASQARRRLLGVEPLNDSFLGSEGHHIDKTHIIFIPIKLHRSVWHSLDKPETMEKINTKVFCWLLGKFEV